MGKIYERGDIGYPLPHRSSPINLADRTRGNVYNRGIYIYERGVIYIRGYCIYELGNIYDRGNRRREERKI